MFTKKTLIMLVIVLSLATITFAQVNGTIVFVIYNMDTKLDPVTGEHPSMPHIYALQEAGYDVITFYNGALSSASDETLDTLLNANLIVLGRSTPSTGYGDHKEAWNGLTTPILNLELWNCRNTRLNWFNTENMSTFADPDTTYKAIIEMQDDPVFEGLDTDNPVPWAVSPMDAVGATEDAGYGVVLARMEGNGTVLFVRFDPDVEFYSGAGDWPAGHRTVIGNGQDASGGEPFNYYNFTPESEKVFLAEVERMVLLGGGTPSAVEDRENTTTPSTLVLSQNYPNPFNPVTNIPYSIDKRSTVQLTVYNLIGEKVATLVDGIKDAGSYQVSFNAANLNSGIYYYKLQKGAQVLVNKMVLVK
jgi:hypothetical protein